MLSLWTSKQATYDRDHVPEQLHQGQQQTQVAAAAVVAGIPAEEAEVRVRRQQAEEAANWPAVVQAAAAAVWAQTAVAADAVAGKPAAVAGKPAAVAAVAAILWSAQKGDRPNQMLEQQRGWEGPRVAQEGAAEPNQRP
jgi:hypothetical protein